MMQFFFTVMIQSLARQAIECGTSSVAPPTSEACFTKWSETQMGRTGSKKEQEKTTCDVHWNRGKGSRKCRRCQGQS